MSEWTIKEHFNLPENWEILRLHDLTTQIVDGTHFTPNYIENGIPFLRVTDIQTKNIDCTSLKFISKEEHELLKLRCSPGKGDILLSKNGTIGLIKIVDWDWEFSIFVSLALIKTKKGIYNQYLKYLLQSEIVWWQIKLRAKQGTVLNLHLEEIRELEIPKAPYEDQIKIAKILSTTDAVIEKTQVAIDKYKAIKQGMLHDLFTRGIDISTGKLRPKYEDAPELYKESKLGMVPKEWEVERLELLTEKIGSGVTPTGGSEVYRTSGVLFIRSQNVLVGRLSTEDIAYISSEIDDKMQFSRVKPFDVLLNITGASIGRCAFFPKELKSANVNQHVCIIRFSKTSKEQAILASEFLNSDFGQSQINRANAGGNRDGLNFQQIKSFSFPVIDFSEIEIISTTIGTITSKIQTEQTYLYKLQKIKAGLMSDLLSGKKKVTIKEEEMELVFN